MLLARFGLCFWPDFSRDFGPISPVFVACLTRNFGLIWPKIKLFERFGGIFSLFGFIIKHLFKLNGFEMTPCFCFRRSSFRDQSLRRLVPGLQRLQLGSKAPSTVSMYKSGWLKWRKWASSKNGKPVNLAKPLYIALFINELTNICVEKFMGVSPIELTLYGGSYYGRDGILPHWSSTREIICRSSEKEARMRRDENL